MDDPPGGPPSPSLSAASDRRRPVPFGVSAIAVALVASLPIWAFDRLEGLLGDLMPEGPTALLVIVGAFAFVWFVAGGAILALFSPRPDREGLVAGVLVAFLMLAILVWDVDVEWQIVALVWFLFGSLAVGCGAVAGLIGARLQRGRSRSAGRVAAVVAIACAGAIATASGVFLGGASGGPGWFVLALVVVLGGSGTWWLARTRRVDAKA